ncbi:OB-fold-containig protein [Rufibacter sp. XAAS-G3-1]|uniref:OB-fold-containig protein n=1 Tax=Rufibacter sp. XAAS-G3-1 TaxID=2729134 RepID=UPI0015E637D1|nr:OB-fold-containig protein [Rufibacter sp. XAAS-G3-1]
MQELLHASLSSANVFASGLLVFVLLYWLTVMAGVLDISSLDVDIDLEADADTAVAGFDAVLAFFHLGRVPLMVFLSFFALPYWAFSVGVNHVLGTQSNWVGLLLVLPLMFCCLFVAKFLTLPFVKLFATMQKEEAPNAAFIGQMCTVLLPTTHTQIGQAALKTKGAPVLLNVKTAQNNLVQKGQTAVVIEYFPENNLYLIEPYPSL